MTKYALNPSAFSSRRSNALISGALALLLQVGCASSEDSKDDFIPADTDTGFEEGWTEPIGAVAVSLVSFSEVDQECVLFGDGHTECDDALAEPTELLQSISMTREGGCGVGRDDRTHCWGALATLLPSDHQNWIRVRTLKGVTSLGVCGVYPSGDVWCGEWGNSGVVGDELGILGVGALDAAPGGGVITTLDTSGTVHVFDLEDGSERLSYDGARALVGVDEASMLIGLDGYVWSTGESDGPWEAISDAEAVVAVGENLRLDHSRVWYVDLDGNFHEDDAGGIEPVALDGLDDPPPIADMDCASSRCTLVSDDGRLYRIAL